MENDTPTLLEIYQGIGDDSREQGDDPDLEWDIRNSAKPEDLRKVKRVLGYGLTDSETRWWIMNVER